MSSHIPLEELAALPNFYFTVPSWSADRIAFYWDKSGRLELYVLNIRTRELTQVSHDELPRSASGGFVWDRRDEMIIFAKDHDGNEQHDLFAIDLPTGSATQLTNNPHCQEYPCEVSPDNA